MNEPDWNCFRSASGGNGWQANLIRRFPRPDGRAVLAALPEEKGSST